MVVAAVAASGAEGCAFTMTVVGSEMQVWSSVLRTKMVCEPVAIPAKVADTR